MIANQINTVYDALTKIETGFNMAGGIPLVGILSGALRAEAGVYQMKGGAVLAVAGLVGEVAFPTFKYWDLITAFGAQNVVHGALNSVKGFLEAGTGMFTIGMGNIVFLILQAPSLYQPFYPYPQLNVSSN